MTKIIIKQIDSLCGDFLVDLSSTNADVEHLYHENQNIQQPTLQLDDLSDLLSDLNSFLTSDICDTNKDRQTLEDIKANHYFVQMSKFRLLRGHSGVDSEMELYSGSADFTNRLSQFTTDNDYDLMSVVDNIDKAERSLKQHLNRRHVSDVQDQIMNLKVDMFRKSMNHGRLKSTLSPTIMAADTDSLKVFRELEQTENRYIKGLEMIMNDFLFEFQSRNILDKNDELYIKIDTLVSPILKFHKAFYRQLTGSRTSIGTMFSKEIGNCQEFYTKFIIHFGELKSEIAKQVKRNVKLRKFLENMGNNNKDLDLYLFGIIQRLPRYELLFRQMYKENNDPTLREAAEKIQEMNQEINRDKSKGELALAAEKIAGFDGDLMKIDRIVILEETCWQKTNKWFGKKEMRWFLFSDLIILTTTKFHCEEQVDFDSIDTVRIEEGQIILETAIGLLQWQAKTKKQAQRWKKTIEQTISTWEKRNTTTWY